MATIETIREHVIRGHINAEAKYPPDLKGTPGVKEMVAQAVEAGESPEAILRDALIDGMDVVGKKFSAGEYFVPEMLMSAKAMKAGLEILRPLLIDSASMNVGTVILGTVQGDMHDIGKNLVGMMLEGAGFEVVDLGINTPPEKFVESAKSRPQAVIGLSALLTITMEKMRTTIEVMRSNGLENKVMIGGAPVTQQFADEIGADGYAPDAADAVGLAKKLLGVAV